MSPAEVMAHIRRQPHARSSFKNLVRELGAKGEQREALEQLLFRLEGKGELICYKPGQYVAASHSKEYVVGRLLMHRDGYGFVQPSAKVEGIQGDIFIPARALYDGERQQAMHGDRVMAHIGWVGNDGKAEGAIVRILKRAHPTVVGEFRVRRRGNWVRPHDDRISQWIFIPDGMEVPPEDAGQDRIGPEKRSWTLEELDGAMVNIEILEYPSGGDDGVGRVVEVLGRPGDFGLDVEITIRKHHLPHKFSAEVLEEARRFGDRVAEEALAGRQDYRELPILTIDGETARDFDDAVYVERLANGNWRLDVHIADVSHYVRPGSLIDDEARFRGTSVYFPDRAVPMLPHELSTGLCSLRPNEDRLVMTAELEIDHQGDTVGQRFCRGVIRSVARMTYTNVAKILDGDADLQAEYAPLLPHLQNMRELALLLNRKRTKRGSIDFDLPEPLIAFDENGLMVGVGRSPRNIAHRLIEEFMLAANEAVAAHIEASALPGIYRIHETPDFKKIADFEEVAAQFGYSLGFPALPVKRHKMVDRKRDGRKVRQDLVMADESVRVSSKAYQKLVAKIEGKAEERILSYLMLRSLKQARYSQENAGHFALAAESYTHFTSPIRRYPDLIVHRVLGALLDGGKAPYSEAEMAEIADDTSFTERRAAEAERELVEWKKLEFMAGQVGETFAGLIISITKFGMFVELEQYFVEGLVPLSDLPGERYRFLEGARKLVGERSKRTFSIGDTVTVLIQRVDAVERRITFGLWEPKTKETKGKKKK